MSDTTRTCAVLLDLHDLSACQFVKHAAVAVAVAGAGAGAIGVGIGSAGSGLRDLVSNWLAWHRMASHIVAPHRRHGRSALEHARTCQCGRKLYILTYWDRWLCGALVHLVSSGLS